MTTAEKAALIIKDIKQEKGTDPVRMFRNIAGKDYINIHGPEHHILDGACILQAYSNAGGALDIDRALDRLMEEGLRMPGAMCGLWGVCGAITSVGAVLAIIDGTGPLSADGTWGDHMQYTSSAVAELGSVNGPRCCKRDAMIAFRHGIEYINSHHDVHLEYEKMSCDYSDMNHECIGDRCPFHRRGKMDITDIFSWLPAKQLSLDEIKETVIELYSGTADVNGFTLSMTLPAYADENAVSVSDELRKENRNVCCLLKDGRITAVIGYSK